MDMNKSIICGRAASDPHFFEGKTEESDRLLLNLMVNRPKSEKADAIPLVIWGKAARAGAEWIQKGKTLLVEGRITTYYDPETKVNHISVTAETVSYGPDGPDGKELRKKRTTSKSAQSDNSVDALAAELAQRVKSKPANDYALLLKKLTTEHGLSVKDATTLVNEYKKRNTTTANTSQPDCPF
jgi:single-stranded DNA-binding protein